MRSKLTASGFCPNLGNNAKKPTFTDSVSQKAPVCNAKLAGCFTEFFARFLTVILFNFFKPGIQNPPATPENKDIIVLPAITQNLEFYLEIQKMRGDKPYGEPFRATGREIFENGYKFKIILSVDSAGYIYLFNEGKNDAGKNVFNLLFPTQDQQNGSPQVKAAQQIKTDDYFFGGAPGKELIWLIWTKESLPELEEIRQSVPPTTGEINTPQTIEKLQNFLRKNSGEPSETKKDDDRQRTILQSKSDIMVYRMELDHR